MQLTLQGKPPAVRDQIRKVEQLGSTRTGKLAKWGFLIGAVTGASLAYASVEGSKGPWVLGQSVGWGAIGALIGAIEGRQSRERVLIYRSP